jgi:hypothetical protein
MVTHRPPARSPLAAAGAAIGVAFMLACGSVTSSTSASSPPPTPVPTLAPVPVPAGAPLSIVGDVANVTDRLLTEIALRGDHAYTGTNPRSGSGSCGVSNPCTTMLRVWDLRPDVPLPILDVPLDGIFAGDAAVSDDGRLLLVPTEGSPTAGIYLFDLRTPAEPRQVARFSNVATTGGVHTAKFGRVGGVLHAFLAANRVGAPAALPSRLIILDLSDPQTPTPVAVLPFGEALSATPAEGHPDVFIHDVFVRDGLLFTASWDGGLSLWDIGGGGRGGSARQPVLLGNVRTRGGHTHNVWWFRAPDGSKRYAFVGQEGPSLVPSQGAGDIHVVDVSNPAAPVEVAFYNVPGGGTHNFAMDEARGILYAAYYDAGVRALDVSGDLGACSSVERAADGRCDLRAMGRERAAQGFPGRQVSIWGVALQGPYVYASDRLNGLWRLTAFTD